MPNKINDTYGAELIGERSKQAAGGLAPLQETKHHGFASKLGFVLAAAGSAVGLGNLWRFPYLAAKYGGGIFILCYLLLAVTFGFCLLQVAGNIGARRPHHHRALLLRDRRLGHLLHLCFRRGKRDARGRNGVGDDVGRGVQRLYFRSLDAADLLPCLCGDNGVRRGLRRAKGH